MILSFNRANLEWIVHMESLCYPPELCEMEGMRHWWEMCHYCEIDSLQKLVVLGRPTFYAILTVDDDEAEWVDMARLPNSEPMSPDFYEWVSNKILRPRGVERVTLDARLRTTGRLILSLSQKLDEWGWTVEYGEEEDRSGERFREVTLCVSK